MCFSEYILMQWLTHLPPLMLMLSILMAQDCDYPEELELPGTRQESGVEEVDVMAFLNLKRAEAIENRHGDVTPWLNTIWCSANAYRTYFEKLKETTKKKEIDDSVWRFEGVSDNKYLGFMVVGAERDDERQWRWWLLQVPAARQSEGGIFPRATSTFEKLIYCKLRLYTYMTWDELLSLEIRYGWHKSILTERPQLFCRRTCTDEDQVSASTSWLMMMILFVNVI